MKNIVTFLIVGDLHGRVPKITETDFDAIICPGDICGDDLRKYLDTPITQEKLREIENSSLQKGRKVLEYLNSFDKPVFYVPGNWDFQPHVDGKYVPEDEGKFESIVFDLDNLINVEDKVVNFNGISFIGHGSTSAPESFTEDDFLLAQFSGDEEEVERTLFFSEIYAHLTTLFENAESPTILLSHNVPLNTSLDIIQAPGSILHNEHYGSKIARELIENYSPLLCIGGHIHEGRGKETINSTLCINAGFGERVMTKITIDVAKQSIENVELL